MIIEREIVCTDRQTGRQVECINMFLSLFVSFFLSSFNFTDITADKKERHAEPREQNALHGPPDNLTWTDRQTLSDRGEI
mmetsp:Transcript_14331/g.28806  ORF Transcript_14331/g.28806 Transcript_14331/m.28806 type:complete len:80 (+) Transcript_14331:80-319(+)